MGVGIRARLWQRITAWLNHEEPPADIPPSDFERLSYEIRPCDVLLVEGRSRIANVIKSITLSNWTHAALYVGRLHDVDDPQVRELVREHYNAAADEQLVIEALLGEGTIVAPLTQYRDEHLRICRPREISRGDAQAVINYCARHLGKEYDVRQLLDLARFLFPYNILPRRWRSSLFTHNAGTPTRTVCSSLLAQAFASVRYPVLPVLREDADGNIHLQRRNFKLFTPRDFDYSPYFDVIKYPVMSFDDLAVYHRLPWDADSVLANGPGDEVVIPAPNPERTQAATSRGSDRADTRSGDDERKRAGAARTEASEAGDGEAPGG